MFYARKLVAAFLLMVTSFAYADNAVYEVLSEVKSQINAARKAGGGYPLIDITSVDVELSTITTLSGDGSIKLWVVDAGAGYKSSSMNKISLRFSLPDVVPVSVSETALSKAIADVREALRLSMTMEPAMTLEKFSYEFRIATTKSAEGKLQIKIVSADADYKLENTHRVVVEMSTF